MERRASSPRRFRVGMSPTCECWATENHMIAPRAGRPRLSDSPPGRIPPATHHRSFRNPKPPIIKPPR
eukprot:4162104-Lingulodinium_polyedra.AAC.1